MDLGLPSGTLWLDRLVGAQSPSGSGLYYQWGAIIGHSATEGYNFSAEAYNEQGLDTISSDLSASQDAARAFYGPSAKMPTREQMLEFIQNTSKQIVPPNSVKFTSLLNNNSIIVPCGGDFVNDVLTNLERIRVWVSTYKSNLNAWALHCYPQDDFWNVSDGTPRIRGLNIMAVHS